MVKKIYKADDMRNTVHLEAKSNYEFLEEQGFVFTDNAEERMCLSNLGRV